MMLTSAFWIQIPYSYSGKNIIGWFKEARVEVVVLEMVYEFYTLLIA